MKESTADVKESIAREQYHDAQYLGTDGEGAVHFWSIYHQAVVVIDDNEVATYELADTPLSTLSEWTAHTKRKRGAWDELLVTDGGILGTVAATVAGGA